MALQQVGTVHLLFPHIEIAALLFARKYARVALLTVMHQVPFVISSRTVLMLSVVQLIKT